MRGIILALGLSIYTLNSFGQITVTAADMPVISDSLRLSSLTAMGSGIVLTDSGANHTWDYSSLVPVAQGLDQYQSAISVNIAWTLIDPTAYGYKIADSLPTGGALPVSIQNIYTFFAKKTSP